MVRRCNNAPHCAPERLVSSARLGPGSRQARDGQDPAGRQAVPFAFAFASVSGAARRAASGVEHYVRANILAKVVCMRIKVRGLIWRGRRGLVCAASYLSSTERWSDRQKPKPSVLVGCADMTLAPACSSVSLLAAAQLRRSDDDVCFLFAASWEWRSKSGFRGRCAAARGGVAEAHLVAVLLDHLCNYQWDFGTLKARLRVPPCCRPTLTIAPWTGHRPQCRIISRIIDGAAGW